MNQQLQQIKKIITTKEGLIAWIIANLITSLHWIIPLIYAFVFKDAGIYALAASFFAIGMTPLVPLWILNIIITVFIWKKIYKKKDLA
jgi:ABC-type Co2+ transport system permease subunit